MRSDARWTDERTDDDETMTPTLLGAVLASWPIWIVTITAFTLMLYLYTNRDLVAGVKAERFYVVILAVVTVVSLGYGALAVRNRIRPYDF